MVNDYDHVSSIGIDTGAKNTGVVLSQCRYGQMPVEGMHEGYFINIAEDKITFGQSARRSKRHQNRGYRRRRMAKRLLSVILRDVYHVDLSTDIKLGEFVMGLLNRRGFTYLTEEMDAVTMDAPGPYWWAEHIPEHFSSTEAISDQIEVFSGDPRKCEVLLEHPVFALKKKKDFADKFRGEMPEDKAAQDQLSASWEEVVKLLRSVVHAQLDGHHPRADYFKHIGQDLIDVEEGKKLCKLCSVKADKMVQLIGHISNLQLRVLRRHFNDETMKNGGRWDALRMNREFARYVRAWHARKPDEKARKRILLDALKTHDGDVLSTWLDSDPKISIPPMEDMNNRRPPKCQSLILDPDRLDADYPEWRGWTDSLKSRELSFRLSDPDQDISASISQPHHQLQVFLDRTREDDPYRIRSLASLEGEPRHELKECMERLLAVLGDASAAGLIRLAGQYYRESSIAANGDWTPAARGGILKKCDRHPPHKAGIRSRLVGALLGIVMTEDRFSSFSNVFGQKFVGSTSLRSLGARCADMQKTYGEAFKLIFEQARGGYGENSKEMLNLVKLVEAGAGHLQSFLESEDEQRFNNPFVYAQLFNILETEPHGFNKTCRTCAAIDGWRSLVKATGRANAKRLPADAGRPFDGMLARLLQRLAWQIADRKITQLEQLPPDARVMVPIVIEENQFRFTSEMQDIKKAQIGTLKDKKIADMAVEVEVEWIGKADRIRQDSCGICPYSGTALSGGQIDHILPRSSTRDVSGTVFNSTANLIYCSTRGNTAKGAKRYTIDDLHPSYLTAVFGTSNREEVRALIEKSLDNILSVEGAVTSFHSLNTNERAIVRHALFVPDLASRVIEKLDQQRVARVNGTQRWLAKQIANIIRDAVARRRPDITVEFRTTRMMPEVSRPIRYVLASHDPLYLKSSGKAQSAYSHVVDAACAVAAYYQDPRSSNVTGIADPIEQLEDPEQLVRWMPSLMKLDHIERKPLSDKLAYAGRPLFKDGIYAIHFVPLMILPDGTAAFGFSLKNYVSIQKGAEQLFSILAPILRDKLGNQAPAYGQALILAQKTKTAIYYHLHKYAAIDLLHRVASGPHDDDAKAASVLEGIAYWTRKCDLSKCLLADPDKKDKVVKSKEELMMGLDVLKLKIRASIAKLDSKPIRNPVSSAWQGFCQHPAVADLLGKPLDPAVSLDEVLRVYFASSGNQRRHRAVRKVYSLPITDKPSGACLIRRKSPSGWIWQGVAVSESCFAGFAQKGNDEIDWSRTVLLRAYTASKNFFKFGEKYDSGLEMACGMDDWMDLPIAKFAPDIDRLRMCPNSDTRCRVEITLSEEAFKKGFGLTSAFDAPSLIEPPECWPWPNLPPPRIKIVAQQLGKSVIFDYIAKNTPSALKTAYQEAWINQKKS